MSFSTLRATAVVAAIVLLSGLLPPVAVAGDTILKTSISSSSIPPLLTQDFGEVLQGQSLVLEITVSNQRDTALKIGAVQPTCACMSETSDRTIEPGKTGTVSLRLETGDYSGPTTEAALIQWIDSAVPVTRVQLKLDVKPLLQVLPRKLVRFRAVRGKAAEQVLELRAVDGRPFKLQRVETSKPFLKAAAAASGNGSYVLTVTLGADAPAGMLKETVTVFTDLPTLPSLKLNVTGLVAAEHKLPVSHDTSG